MLFKKDKYKFSFLILKKALLKNHVNNKRGKGFFNFKIKQSGLFNDRSMRPDFHNQKYFLRSSKSEMASKKNQTN